MDKNAFSLFELVIYLSLFFILNLLVFSFLSKISKKMFLRSSEIVHEVRSNVLLDLLKRDIFCSNRKLLYWDTLNFVFRKENIDNVVKDICWQSRKDGIYRITGRYNYLTKKWIKKNSTRLDLKSQNLSFDLILDKENLNVLGVKIVFNDNDNYAFIRNRIIHNE